MPTLGPGSTARIRYGDAGGVTSERTITVEARFTSRHGITYLRAYCHLRGESRTFRLDRILSVLNAHVGSGCSRSEPAAPPVPGAPAAAPHRPPRRGGARSARADDASSSRTGGRTSSTDNRVASPGLGNALARLVAGTVTILCVTWLLTEADGSGAPTGVSPPPAPPVAITPASQSSSGRIPEASSGHGDELTALFVNADEDRNGSLTWSELQAFQDELFRGYTYQRNNVALEPREFMEAGGGDCEDWALVTAALLRFWGIEARIGLIKSEQGNHAVTLVPVASVPSGFLRITTGGEDALVATSYVPVDYTRVGALSSAVGESYTVMRVWRPEEIVGKWM